MARIGVIRTDVDKVHLTDLEPVSQWAPSVEPLGQERAVARPVPDVSCNSGQCIETILAADSNSLTAAQITATAPLIIARALPAGGPVDVTDTNLNFDYSGVDAAAFDFNGSNMDAGTATALADELAPSFVETGVFCLSFDHGVIAGYLDSNYEVGGTTGSAVGVIDDDGSTTFTLP